MTAALAATLTAGTLAAQDAAATPGTNPVIQRLATGGILHRPSPDNPDGSVSDYSGAVLK